MSLLNLHALNELHNSLIGLNGLDACTSPFCCSHRTEGLSKVGVTACELDILESLLAYNIKMYYLKNYFTSSNR